MKTKKQTYTEEMVIALLKAGLNCYKTKEDAIKNRIQIIPLEEQTLHECYVKKNGKEIFIGYAMSIDF